MQDKEGKVHFGFEQVSKEQKQRQVYGLFSRVAKRYDLMNDVMSLGIHRLWKDRVVIQANPQPGEIIIDLASGTGDLAERCFEQVENVRYFRGKRALHSFSPKPHTSSLDTDALTVFLVDINSDMLRAGKNRQQMQKRRSGRQEGLNKDSSINRHGFMGLKHFGIYTDVSDSASVSVADRFPDQKERLDPQYWICGNGQALPFTDSFADCVLIGFGMRNISDMPKTLKEIHRVLKPGGRFLCLEFSHPKPSFLNDLYAFYSFKVIPKLGKFIARDQAGYQYLVDSIRTFPQAKEFADMIEQAGFHKVDYRFYSGGVVAVHQGWA